jgi:hypothetical protein
VIVCALVLSLGGFINLAVLAQNAVAPQNAPALQAEQLDQLLAPIALYPDPLIAQILMAATYPLEVVEASRWLDVPANAGLKGNQLTTTLQQQSWDPSVKSLVPFPLIMQMMSDKLDWTQDLGNAFLAQQADVMNSVQRLRHQAQKAGHLASTPQQVVSSQDQSIVVEPANPETVYVPEYDPNIVYGDWPYPDYPPFFFPLWPGYVLAGGFAFGFGFPILAPFWGWDGFDWGNRYIHIDAGRYNGISRGQSLARGGIWQHDPAHRQGVPYRNAAVRSQYNAARLNAQHATLDARGYDRATGVSGNTSGVARGAANEAASVGSATTPARGNQVAPEQRGNTVPVATAGRAGIAQSQRQLPAAPRAPASAFEGVERGGAVRADAARGQASRQMAAHSGGGMRSSSGGSSRGGSGRR